MLPLLWIVCVCGTRERQGLAFLITDPYLMENCRFDYFVQNAETERGARESL